MARSSVTKTIFFLNSQLGRLHSRGVLCPPSCTMSLRPWNTALERDRFRQHVIRAMHILEAERMMEDEPSETDWYDDDDDDDFFDDDSMSIDSEASYLSYDSSASSYASGASDIGDDDSTMDVEDQVLGSLRDMYVAIYGGIVDDTIPFGERRIIADFNESQCLGYFRWRKDDLQDTADQLWPRLQPYLVDPKDRILLANVSSIVAVVALLNPS